MAHIQYVDELVREYLLYRGFTSTLKTFDAELKVDKEKGFRVDKIVDQLLQYIYNYDLVSLRDLWNHFDVKMFSKLEAQHATGVKKIENSLLKIYVVNAIMNNKQDKVTEFFTKMTPELQNQSEWKDWFMLPYIKNPEDNQTFAGYFTRQWQDTVLVSLHNSLSTIFQCMPQPTLTNFEEDTARLKRLQDENEALKLRLAQLSEQYRGGSTSEITPCDVPPLDDFYVIASENNSVDNQAKGLKSLIKNIGAGSSPTMGRKEIGNKKRLGSGKNWRTT